MKHTRPTRLRPVEALAGGGGRYRFAEVRPKVKDSYDALALSPDYIEPECACRACGYIRCGCAAVVSGPGTVTKYKPGAFGGDFAAWWAGNGCSRCAIASSGRCSWHPAELPKAEPADGLEWEEIEVAEFDMSYLEYHCRTVDGFSFRVSAMTMRKVGYTDLEAGDTVGFDHRRFVRGFNGEVFE